MKEAGPIKEISKDIIFVNQSKKEYKAIREGYIPIRGAELFKMYCNYCSKYEKTCGLTLTTFGTNIKNGY